MSKSKHILTTFFNLLISLIVIALLARLIILKPRTFLNIVLVLMGFGAVIMIHEFGHFIVAKLSGIKVEAFSIGFPPTLLGIKKIQDGIRFRLLPRFFHKHVRHEDEAGIQLTLHKKSEAADTEYRIGLIPFGGYVKMLGQEDTGPVEKTSDPRSFTNKPISIRIAVVAAGVIFNLIGAFIIFTFVASIGIKLRPAVVGAVMPGLPAEVAGIVAGDEIIEINGKTNPDFADLVFVPALSGKDEEILLKVKHADGTLGKYKVATAPIPGMNLRGFGIDRAQSLKLASIEEAGDLYERIGLQGGDEIFAVNYENVSSVWQLREKIGNMLKPGIILSARRSLQDPQQTQTVNSTLELEMTHTTDYALESEADLTHIYSIVPRLRITAVSAKSKSSDGLIHSLLKKVRISKDTTGPAKPQKQTLEPNDIIIKVSDIEYPTFFELRRVTSEHNDKKMSLTVLRPLEDGTSRRLDIEVTPHTPPGGDRPIIGIMLTLDAENPILAKTITTKDGPAALEIPRGAAITRVDGVAVSNFYEIIDVIRNNMGQKISLEYRLDNKTVGAVMMEIPKQTDYITVKSQLTDIMPFEDLKRTYKADDPIEAVLMGSHQIVRFVAQPYIMIKNLILGLLSPDNLMGPVGIASASYKIVAAKQFTFYLYFMAMISCFLAVVNFLPLPIVDGGLVVLLIIEKLKGSPISTRAQEIISYAGLALIISLAVYLTYNDILRLLLPT